MKMRTALVFILLLNLFFSVSFIGAGAELEVGIVDIMDSFTLTQGLGELLKDENAQISEISNEVRTGSLEPDKFDIIMFGSFATTDKDIKRALNTNKKIFQEFVNQGKLLVILAQLCDDEAIMKWLPG